MTISLADIGLNKRAFHHKQQLRGICLQFKYDTAGIQTQNPLFTGATAHWYGIR